MSSANGDMAGDMGSDKSRRRVVITGTGALSRWVGPPQDLWNGLIANRPGIRTVERLVASGISVTSGVKLTLFHTIQVDRDHEIAKSRHR